MSLYRILHWTTEYLTVRDVAVAAANDRRNSFDTETQISPRTLDLHGISFFHEGLKRFHPRLQFAVIESADTEEEVLERFRAHARLLCHGGSGPAQDDPFCFLH